MNNLIWIGIRESEVKYTNFIESSISVFGKNNLSLQRELGKNINHNKNSNQSLMNDFYNQKMIEIVKQNDKARFMCYSQIYIYSELKRLNLLDKVVCLNNQETVLFAHDKFKVKEYFNDIIPILDFKIILGRDFDYSKLCKEFNTEKLVLQLADSSGGFGTILVDKNTDFEPNKNSSYMVTKYCENNIPINVSVLISDKTVTILPLSIQLIERFNDRLMYKGSDFISYRDLVSNEITNKAKEHASKIASFMQKKGYRGFLGMDMIVYEDEVYLMEINPRFQNSSSIINKALMDNNMPSLQELNYNCFKGENITLNEFNVNYSSYINEYGQAERKIDAQKIESLDLNNYITEYEDMSYICTDLYNEGIVKKETLII